MPHHFSQPFPVLGVDEEEQRLLESARAAVRECHRKLRALSEETRVLYQQRLAEWEQYSRQSLEQVAALVDAEGARLEGGDQDVADQQGRQALTESDLLLRDKHTELAERVYRVQRTAQMLGSAGRRLKKEGERLQPGVSGLLPLWDNEDREGEFHDRILQAHEQERLRLAREIHDGPAQILANAIFELEYFERLLDRDPDSLRAQLSQLRSDMREGMAEVRRFIFGLRPPPLSDVGLFAALHQYLEDFAGHFGLSLEIELPETRERLPATKEVAIFRIVQEAVQNIQKHAGASRIAVRAEMDSSTLLLSVEDDGRGFDLPEVANRHSRNLGLISMRERAELIDAQLQITTSPGQGARIVLVAPMGRDPSQRPTAGHQQP